MGIGIEGLFGQLLNLGESWEVYGSAYDEVSRLLVLRVRETARLVELGGCPRDGRHRVELYDHAPLRRWRHLNVFNTECVIECALPRLKCGCCGKVWRVKPPWEGKSKGLSHEFEAFALMLMKEMPVKRASEILGETDERLWRVLRAYVAEARERLDYACVTRVGVDEMSYRKGHRYLSVFADLAENRVLFATPGRDHSVWEAFSDELLRRNGHPHALVYAAMDMSPAYQRGVRENCRNAQVVFDKFHVMKLLGECVDQVRQGEQRRGDTSARKQLKGTRWLWRKNPQNLTPNQQAHFSRIDHQFLWTAKAYQMRLALQHIYNEVPYRSWAERRLTSWCNWAHKTAENTPHLLLKPIKGFVKTVRKHWEGILNYWSSDKMTTAYLEGLNSVFSAVKRKARGYRNTDNLIAMLYFVAAKLNI